MFASMLTPYGELNHKYFSLSLWCIFLISKIFFVAKPEETFFKARADCLVEMLLWTRWISDWTSDFFFFERNQGIKSFLWLLKQFGATILWEILNLGKHLTINIHYNLHKFYLFHDREFNLIGTSVMKELKST